MMMMMMMMMTISIALISLILPFFMSVFFLSQSVFMLYTPHHQQTTVDRELLRFPFNARVSKVFRARKDLYKCVCVCVCVCVLDEKGRCLSNISITCILSHHHFQINNFSFLAFSFTFPLRASSLHVKQLICLV